jgi:hypothetical protein
MVNKYKNGLKFRKLNNNNKIHKYKIHKKIWKSNKIKIKNHILLNKIVKINKYKLNFKEKIKIINQPIKKFYLKTNNKRNPY